MPDSPNRLSAPPKAQQAHAKKAKRGLLTFLGPLGQRTKKGKREAKPPARIGPTAADPTTERKFKEPYDWQKKVQEGDQVQHRLQVFLDTYWKHLNQRHLHAVDLIKAGFELRDRERLISARAYSGMPGGSGASGDRAGHALRPLERTSEVPLTAQDRKSLLLFDKVWARFTSQNSAWAERIEALILHRKDERTGRVRSVDEIGAAGTRYLLGSDNSKAAGVAFGLDALDVFMQDLQIVLLEEDMASMARRQRLTAEATAFALRRARGGPHKA